MSISIDRISKASEFDVLDAKIKIFVVIACYLGTPTTTKHVEIQLARLINNF
jgi:hypothetical protein